MKSVHRLLCVFALMALVAGAADSLFAQKISIGGFSQGGNKANQNNNNNQNDDDDHNDNQNSNRQGKKYNPSGGNSNVEQFQQFIPGGQGGQGQGQVQGNQGQGGSNQFRRNQLNQPGQGGNNQQFQNWQNNNGNNQNSIKIGTWQGGKWNGSHKIQNWTQAYGGNQTPFSDQWYKDHPKAWKHDHDHDHVDVWTVATVPGLYGWLGWGNVPQQYNVNYGNVPQHYNYDDYGDWYPLGVYSLMAGPGDSGTRIVQLAIDRHGHINGNYYDMITNSNYSVSGDVSQQSQRVSWSLNKNQAIKFRAHIGQLMQPYGTISVRLPGGEQQWQFVRLEN